MLQHFLLKKSAVIKLIATGNPANSCVTFTLDKALHGPVIAPFAVQVLRCLETFFNYAGRDQF